MSNAATTPEILEACETALDAMIGHAIPAGEEGDREAILAAQQRLRKVLAKARGQGEVETEKAVSGKEVSRPKSRPKISLGTWVVFRPGDYRGNDDLPGLGVEVDETGDAVVWAALEDWESGLKNDDDAYLIAAAGTAAYQIHQRGFDPIAAMEQMPALFDVLCTLRDNPAHGEGDDASATHAWLQRTLSELAY